MMLSTVPEMGECQRWWSSERLSECFLENGHHLQTCGASLAITIDPPSNSLARSSPPRSLAIVNPWPLIQYFVARSIDGKAVSRQSAGLLVTDPFSDSAMGRADSLISRAKN